MKFFRGHALIRGGTMAINTPCLKGARLLGWARFQASILQGARSSKGARFSTLYLAGGTSFSLVEVGTQTYQDWYPSDVALDYLNHTTKEKIEMG